MVLVELIHPLEFPAVISLCNVWADSPERSDVKGACMVTQTKRRSPPATEAAPLLAGFDTITYSSRAHISADIRVKLAKEKEAAQIAAKAGAVHCPEWLGAVYFRAVDVGLVSFWRRKTSP
jgi:hypothetical protein